MQTGRRKLSRLWDVVKRGIYRALGWVHRALVTDAGLLLAVFVPILFREEIDLQPISFALWALYVVCDLVRLRFLQGATISLGFPLVFLTLLADSPFAALVVATIGSLISESLHSRLLAKQHLSWPVALHRGFFYAGHHAVAGFGALIVYCNIRARVGFWFGVEAVHIPATLVYIILYSLVSMLLVWPHDIQIRLFLAPSEEPFVRIHWLMSLLLLPIPAIVFYLCSSEGIGQIEKILVVLGVLPPLFTILFLLARSFASTEEEREGLALRQKVRSVLGSPANMAELVEGMLAVIGNLVDYRWGAVYSLVNGNLELYGVKPAKGCLAVRNPGQGKEVFVPFRDGAVDGNQVVWPLEVESGLGILDGLARGALHTQFYSDGLVPSSPLDPYLPKKAALIAFPIVEQVQGAGEGESSRLIGLVALVRLKRRFTNWDWRRGQALTSESVNVLRSVQRLEKAMHEVYRNVREYGKDREKVRQAVDALVSQHVDVPKILAIISERAFQGNVRAVLRDVVERRQGYEVTMDPDTLAEIYDQARDETPGMPPLDPDILDCLQTITSSLSLAFSFRYQFPDVERGPAFREFYDFLLVALDANTTPRIAALDSQIVSTIEIVRQRTAREVGSAALPQEAIEEVEGLWDIVRLLMSYDQTEDPTDKRAFLGQALEVLEEREQSVKGRLRDPERFVFLQILPVWQAAVANTLEDMKRGPARLRVELRSHRALPLEETALELMVQNEGPGVARRLVVQLEPTEDYEVVQGRMDLGMLASGKKAEPRFKLRPIGEGPLRLEFRITYHDSERSGKTEKFADLLHLREPPSCFNEIPNPYTPGLPLGPGDLTFVGRDDIFNFIRQNIPAIARKMVLVLIGERRTGKTSILRQLPDRLKDPNCIPVFVDGQSLGIDPGLGNFFLSLALSIGDGLDSAGIPINPLGFAEFRESPKRVFERQFLPMVREQIGDRVLLLTVDEFEELGDRVRRERLPPEIFSYLRHLIQHEEQLAFIFAGTHRVEEMVGDYWSVLFNIAKYKKVGFLEREETVRLITEPVQAHGIVYDDLAIDEVLRLTACHPYFTQLLCAILVNQCNEARCSYVTVRDVRDAVREFLETGRAHLTFLWRTSDRETKLTLATLAQLRERLDQVTTAAIAGRLGNYHIPMDPGQVTRAMQRLSARDIVREIPSDPVSYDFTAQLYAQWLQRYQPLSRVVEEADVELSGLPQREGAAPALVTEELSGEQDTD